MNLTLEELEAVAAEMEPLLSGAQIQTIRQPRGTAVWMGVHGRQGPYGVLLETAGNLARVHLEPDRPSTLNPPPAFVCGLRAHLEGARIVALDLPWPDRVCVIRCQRGEEKRALILECSGHHANLFLADWEGEIQLALRPTRSQERDLRPGAVYEPPRAATAPTGAGSRISGETSPSVALASHFAQLEADLDLKAARQERLRLLRQRHKRLLRSLAGAQRDYEQAARWPESQRLGDLLKANFSRLQAGVDEIQVVDYFDPNQKLVDVPMDPAISVAANVEKAYGRARKGRRGEQIAATRIEEIDSKRAAVAALLTAVEDAPDLATLLALDDQVRVFCPAKAMREGEANRRKGRLGRLPYRLFVASTGRPVWVGRGGRDNHALTFQHASPHDLWLHVRGFPGSHVIIPMARTQEADSATLLDAATLAIHYSKAPDSGYNEVMWTRRKYVRAVRKGAPGQVIAEQEKNLAVAWEQARLDALLRRETFPPAGAGV